MNANVLDVGADVIKTITASPMLIAIGVIAALMTVLFGAINSLIISAIVTLTSYNNFVNESSIIGAWVIIRDLCNMFFILILLVVAFAAILRIESYQWKKILPKLLIMAVLINFSRTFCGLIIDASQIIMLTFVNAWAGNGSGFVVMTRMTTYFSSVIGNEFSKFGSGDYSILNIVVGMLVGIMFLMISGIVLLVALAVFLMRVIMLWIYIVLSPLAFMAAAFPAGQKYASQWWSEFIKYIINGPVLAFFIWMAFMVSAQIDKDSSILFNNTQCFGLTQGMCLNNFLPFIISIGMLLGGLIITQQIGGVGSSIAGKGLDWAKKSLAAPGKLAGWGGKLALFKAGRTADTLQMKAQKGIMQGLLKVPEYHAKSLNYRMIASGWEKNRRENLEKYETFGGKGAPLDTVWQENFKKHLQLRQYGVIRKSQSRYTQDKEQAGKLESQNEIDNNRIRFNKMSDDERDNELKKYDDQKYKQKRIAYYNNKGYNGEEEVNKDTDILVGASFDAASAEKRMKENEPIIEKLMDPRLFGKGLISAGKAAPFEYEKSKAGAQEVFDKATKEMDSETGGVDFKVNNRLIKAIKENDTKNIIAALRIQNKNNNFNEIMKDHRVIKLMTESNGLLEKLNRQEALAKDANGKGRVLDDGEMKALKDDISNRPVTPAHVQAMIRGVLANAGMKDNVSARHAADLGDRSFVAGNGLAYGMAMGDEASGDYKFENFDFKDGRLVTSERRKAAVAGKFSNIESQLKMRTLHPDLFISEAPDGSAVDLTDDGEYMMKSLSAHDMAQIGRMRPDAINKIAASAKAIDNIKKFADGLEADGEKQAADLIRYMGGYIKNSRARAMGLKDYKEAIEAMGGTA